MAYRWSRAQWKVHVRTCHGLHWSRSVAHTSYQVPSLTGRREIHAASTGHGPSLQTKRANGNTFVVCVFFPVSPIWTTKEVLASGPKTVKCRVNFALWHRGGFLSKSHVVEDGLEILIHRPWPPKYFDYRHASHTQFRGDLNILSACCFLLNPGHPWSQCA